MREHQDPHPRLSGPLRGGLAAGLSILLGVSTPAPAQDPAGGGPVASPPAAAAPAAAPVLTLEECLRLGRLHQPSLRAAGASLASAEAAQRGLNAIRFGARLSRELPVRKQQSAHGVAAASANLCQVQRDVDASVARLYFAVIYAREQRQVAQQISDRLKAVVGVGETLLGKEGAPPDLNPVQVGKAKGYAALASTRLDEANRGLQRATAALREAMGIGPDFQFTAAEGKLPEVLPGVNKDQIVRLATTMRGEVSMADHGAAAAQLEIQAQAAAKRTRRPTAAAGADVHARPIPTGSFGDDYKPGAIGLDFPTLFVGPKEIRVERATAVAGRASAAADKARNLIALEAEDAFYKWEEAVSKIGKLAPAAKETEALAQRATSALDSGVIQSYRDVLEVLVLGAQIQAQLNEARYNHAVALTELERVTGGGFPTVACHVP